MPRAAANHWLLTCFHINDLQAQLDEWKTWYDQKVTNKAKITYVTGCLELCPESGKQHGHVYIQLSCNVTFAAIKEWVSAYEDSPHVYSFGSGGNADDSTVFCKGSSDDCRQYIWKPETKIAEFDPIEVGTLLHIKGKSRPGRGARTDLQAVKEAIDNGKRSLSELFDEHFETVAKYPKFIESYLFHVSQSKISTAQKERYLGATLRPWQQTLWQRLQGPVDPRKVHWYWEPTGNVGKSFMAAYATFVAGAITIPVGKLHDMCYVLSKQTYPIYIIDIPRTYEDKLDGVFTMIEMIKSGKICSYKYESKIMLLEPAHVVVFSNFMPNQDAWSADRYDITNLGHNQAD